VWDFFFLIFIFNKGLASMVEWWWVLVAVGGTLFIAGVIGLMVIIKFWLDLWNHT
jgi:hypothetical protein